MLTTMANTSDVSKDKLNTVALPITIIYGVREYIKNKASAKPRNRNTMEDQIRKRGLDYL